MMKLLNCIVASVFLLNTFASAALANIILTVDSETFNQNSGVQTVDIFVRSTSADQTIFLTADFRIEAGVFPTSAGSFGLTNFVGEGNIQIGSSFFVSAGNAEASLTLDFSNPQLIPAIDTLVARMNIDTSGIPLGNYAIQVTSLRSQATTNQSFNGAFTIQAVPEPSAFALIGLCGVCVLSRRRKRI